MESFKKTLPNHGKLKNFTKIVFIKYNNSFYLAQICLINYHPIVVTVV